MSIFVTFCIISTLLFGIYCIFHSSQKIPFETHKEMNATWYKELSSHSDLKRFLEEFESVKDILGISKKSCDNSYRRSLFPIDFNMDSKDSMNGDMFIIKNVKYIAKNFSDYKKATKVIQEHYNFCKEHNIYTNWI